MSDDTFNVSRDGGATWNAHAFEASDSFDPDIQGLAVGTHAIFISMSQATFALRY